LYFFHLGRPFSQFGLLARRDLIRKDMLFYPSQKNNLKICDSKTIESSYVGEKPVCYDESIYQGPVRPTDDENNFRQTGKTIPMENKN
jgi:hypothetical protein